MARGSRLGVAAGAHKLRTRRNPDTIIGSFVRI